MIQKVLESKRFYLILLFLNVLVILGLFWASRHETGGDADTYTGLADGILHGRYSFWWFMPSYHPDTFRNPGYPLFIAFVRLFSTSYMTIRVIQLFLYFASIYLALKIIEYYTDRLLVKNIFLILLLMSINVTAYITLILPEILVLFLVTLSLHLDQRMDAGKWYKYVVLGFLYGYIFEIRPVFLFVPFIKLAYDWYFRRDHTFHYAYQALTIAVFLLSTLPYGFWNKKNNGVFSITSLEGGGGLVHSAQWAFKIPGYRETRYWGNAFQPEMLSEKDTEKVKQNILAFNKEWDYIDSSCRPYITQKDSELITYKAVNKSDLWMTYNARYTLERERLLKKLTLQHYKEDPYHTIVARAYTFCRVWFTGIFWGNNLTTVKDKGLSFISPYLLVSLLSLFIFLSGVVFIPLAFLKNKSAMSSMGYPIVLMLYWGFIHIPFAIQSRYTTPVKLFLIMTIAYAVALIFFPDPKNKKSTNEST